MIRAMATVDVGKCAGDDKVFQQRVGLAMNSGRMCSCISRRLRS